MLKQFIYYLCIIIPFIGYTQCVDTLMGERENLGIFGGRITDLTLSRTSNRLFCGTETPINFFFSDDAANNWHQSFPLDSMSYDCDTRGWAGELKEILTNNNGWVASYTYYGANFTSSQISFTNGDSGTFTTALDPAMLTQYGFTMNSGNITIRDIDLSDDYLFVCLDRYIVKMNSGLFKPSNVFNTKDTLDVKNNKVWTLSVSATNNVYGFPFVALLDTNDNQDQSILIQYDGNSTSLIQLPDTTLYYERVYLPRFSLYTDTIFVVARNTSNTATYVFRTYNNGTNWTNISNNYTSALTPDFSNFKVDYSSNWKAFFPQSNGHILLSHLHFSVDLGNSWIESPSSVLPSVMSYTDTSTIYIAQGEQKGVYLINSFYANSNPSYQKNEGLEAIEINGISQSKGIVYITTNLGIGYTTAYNNSSVTGSDKWTSPYGGFPIGDATIYPSGNAVYSSVKISPFDSLHIIASSPIGFALSFYGPDSLKLVTPPAYLDAQISDIEFVSDKIVLASDENTRIWRSEDGGMNWTSFIDSATSFNDIAVGYSAIDTIVYAVSGICNDSSHIWRSNDLGMTWNSINNGLPPNLYGSYPLCNLAVDFRSNDTLYLLASCSQGSTQQASLLLKSTDGGITFSDTINLGYNTAYGIAQNKEDSSIMYIAAGTRIFRYNADSSHTFSFYKGLVNDAINCIEYGSILLGTTTGFYGIFYDETADVVVSSKSLTNTENELEIFPNPSADKLYLKLNIEKELYVTVAIYDVYGKLVHTQSISNRNYPNPILLDVKQLCNGTYFIKVSCEKQFAIAKFMLIR